MFKYILLAVFAVVFVGMLIFSKTSYNRVIKVYKKYNNEFVYCGFNGYQFACFAIDKLKLKTKIKLIDGELNDCYFPQRQKPAAFLVFVFVHMNLATQCKTKQKVVCLLCKEY